MAVLEYSNGDGLCRREILIFWFGGSENPRQKRHGEKKRKEWKTEKGKRQSQLAIILNYSLIRLGWHRRIRVAGKALPCLWNTPALFTSAIYHLGCIARTPVHMEQQFLRIWGHKGWVSFTLIIVVDVLWKRWDNWSLCPNFPCNLAITGPLRTTASSDVAQDILSGICLTSWEQKAVCWRQCEDHGVTFSDNVYSTSVICVLQGSWDWNHMCCLCINGNLRRRGHNTIKMFSFRTPIPQTHANNYSQTLIMVLQDATWSALVVSIQGT